MPRKRRAAHGSKPPKVTPIKRGPKKSWRWRAQVFDPLADGGQGKWVTACSVLGEPAATFASEAEGWEKADKAEAALQKRGGVQISVAQIRERWLARERDAKGHKIKDSTHIINRERTARLAESYGSDHPMAVADVLLAAARELSPPYRAACKAMFNWAVHEGLLAENPVARLAINKSKGNEEVFPPTEQDIERLLAAARQILPDFADWIEFGKEVGTRPGETDALEFGDFSHDLKRVRILRAYNVKTRRIETPKKVHTHWIAVPPRAQMIVRRQMAQQIDPTGFVFRNTRGEHWTSSSRAYYWKAAMAAAGFSDEFTCYLATRHYCGWFYVNVKTKRNGESFTSEEVAHQLRHDDHGELVRRLYGKRDRRMAIDAIVDSYEDDDGEEAVA